MLNRLIILCGCLTFGLYGPASADADGPDFFSVTGVAANDVLNIRSEPSASSQKTGQIPPDGNGIRNLGCTGGLSYAEWEKATESEREAAAKKRWCQVEYKGATGWVAGWFLTEGSEVAHSDPAFDCSKASGEVETRICADPWLGRLDRELSRLYGLALAGGSVSEDRRAELKAYQRGWIKGRNDCWKAGDIPGCISASYVQRIAELRTGYADARSQDANGLSAGPFAYACPGFDALLSVTSIAADPAAIAVRWRENEVSLTQVPAASGSRFEDAAGEFVFWMKGEDALFSRPNHSELNCKTEETG
ncbi:SH3 domain-containing protein [Primorskyibacter sp. S87]|uniref:SH3 domain-containing protein n=1 Tax=Primorskyibacter sp. S87 TaxID=3415126 RepID=UPI003C7E14B1